MDETLLHVTGENHDTGAKMPEAWFQDVDDAEHWADIQADEGFTVTIWLDGKTFGVYRA